MACEQSKPLKEKTYFCLGWEYNANTLAKISYGFCDNLLTSIIRAWDWTKPMFLCPAMNTMMWDNKPTLEQISLLKNWGATVIEPIEKKLACNDVGMGAMASIEDIVRTVEKASALDSIP